MSSWGWSSWLLFGTFLLVAFAFGFTLRDLIQQRRDKNTHPKIEWGRSFTITMDGRTEFVGRFTSVNHQLGGPSTAEATDEASFMRDRRL
jgi:hypothetical protein